jgi:hypothetical protein
MKLSQDHAVAPLISTYTSISMLVGFFFSFLFFFNLARARQLYLSEFMQKIQKNSVHMELWSDAFETCSMDDTWFS